MLITHIKGKVSIIPDKEGYYVSTYYICSLFN